MAGMNGAGRPGALPGLDGLAAVARPLAAAMLPAVAFGMPADAEAQTAAPITITPRTLAPELPAPDVAIDIPAGGAIAPPKGAEGLAITLGKVELAGGFAEVAGETAAITARLEGRRLTLAEIYAAASEIEAVHARAGFVLARVSIPPQKLANDGPLRIVVTDGFIEAVDVSGLPARVRAPVRRAMAGLVRHPHVRMHDIEQALVIAGDTPGLTLRSTLARGEEQGGARLILEGPQRLLVAQVGANNGYDAALGRYAVSAELSLNSLLGQGETIYGFIASHYDLGHLFAETSPAAIAGGGVVMRLARGRLTVNPEVTFSRTRPMPSPGAPQTVGKLRRITVRTSYALARTRTGSTSLSLGIEHIDVNNLVSGFGVELSHDRYMTARLGASMQRTTASGTNWAASLRLNQGLGGLGAIRPVAGGVPFSRVGATTSFTNLAAEASVVKPAGKLALTVQTRGQWTFGRPQLRSEQFALEGSDGLSAWIGGATSVDEGGTARFELAPAAPVAVGKLAVVRPYVFAAGGAGRINRPTILEPGNIRAAAFGAGASFALAGPRLRGSVEYARGVSSWKPISGVNRVGFTLALQL